jgi:hypothetical protein
MSFKVYQPSGAFECGDDDKFEIIDGGVLQITHHDRTEVLLSAMTWERVEHTPPVRKAAAIR